MKALSRMKDPSRMKDLSLSNSDDTSNLADVGIGWAGARDGWCKRSAGARRTRPSKPENVLQRKRAVACGVRVATCPAQCCSLMFSVVLNEQAAFNGQTTVLNRQMTDLMVCTSTRCQRHSSPKLPSVTHFDDKKTPCPTVSAAPHHS